MQTRRGSGLYEFFLLIALIAVLAGSLLARLDAVQGEAERLEVELTVRNIRVGMQLAIGELIMHGQEARIAELARRRPIDFLGRTPRGYIETAGIAGNAGEWRWDGDARRLSYRPHHPAEFDGAGTLRWQVLARTDSTGRVVGVSFVQESP